MNKIESQKSDYGQFYAMRRFCGIRARKNLEKFFRFLTFFPSCDVRM